MSDHRCEGRVFLKWDYYRCGKKGKYEHDGKWYCKRHHPPSVAAKEAERILKWNAEDAARQAKQRAEQEAKDELARRAAAYNRHIALMYQALEAMEGLFGVPDEFTGSGGGGVAVWRGDGSEPVHKAITALRVALEGNT